MDDLKTKKVKKQKTTLVNEDEEDEESISVQAEEEKNEENEEIQEEGIDISEDEDNTHEEVPFLSPCSFPLGFEVERDGSALMARVSRIEPGRGNRCRTY